MKGEIFIILAQLVWAISSLFVKKLLQDTNPLLVTSLIAFLGTIFVFPFLIYFWNELKIFTPQKLIWAILAGLFWIALGEIFYSLGLRKVPISRASLLALSFPFFTTLLGVIFLSEKITLRFILGTIFMVIGYIILVM